jgi:hypothetical protein
MNKPNLRIPEELERTRIQHYPNTPQEAFFALSDFLFFIRVSNLQSR